VIPLAILLGGFWLPYIKLNDSNYGSWFLTKKGKRSALYSLVAAMVATPVFILASEFLPDPEKLIPRFPSLITMGIIPFTLVAGSVYFFLKILHKKLTLNRSETIQSLLIVLVCSYVVLTLTGIFFRGEGMNLMWPWQI